MLNNLSKSETCKIIENNLLSLMDAFSFWSQTEIFEIPHVRFSLSHIQFPLFNSVMDANLSTVEVGPTVKKIVELGKEKNVPLLWWVGSASKPNDLYKYLENYGFKSIGSSPGMAVDTERLKSADVNELVIKPVTTKLEMCHWIDVFGAGFDFPPFVLEAFDDLFRAAKKINFTHFVGYLDKEPVAVSMLAIRDGVGGLYNIAVRPEYRRRGFGSFITNHTALHARQLGCEVCVLHSSDMGLKIYQNLGFVEYCKIDQYLWEK